MSKLDGKVAVVTGAGRGIGREHALALARAGAKIVVNDLGASLTGEGADAGPAHDVVREIEALGGAAVADGENVADFAGAKRVINTSSPSGVFGNVGQLNYGAAKAGIVGFTLIAAQELQRYGVTVNAIAPNARTRMTEAAFGEIPPPENGFDAADPANNSPIVVALCADEAQDITGQVFFIYGGVVNMLRGWETGELFASDERWDPDALLQELRDRLPDGAAPP